MSAPSKILRVLMLSTDPRVLGGITNFTATLIRHAKRSQFSLVPLGSVIDQAGGGRHESATARIYRLLRMPFIVARMARTADVIHLNTPFNPKGLVRDGLVLLALSSLARRKTLLYFHGWREELAPSIAKNALLRGIFCSLLQHVGQILVLAPQFKQHLVEIGIAPQRITLTHTMFEGTDLAHAVSQPNERHKILFLARMVREKGVEELLDAFLALAADYPDTDLILAGDGPHLATIMTRVGELPITLQSRIHLPGYMTGAAKAALLKNAHVFALPTYYPEGLPVALLEAMAAGLPVLTTPVGGIKQVIRDGEQGVLLEHVTSHTVEAGLRRLLSDPTLCARIGAANATYAWAQFEASRVTAGIEALYVTLAGEMR